MPTVQAILQGGIQGLQDSHPPDINTAASQWASAFSAFGNGAFAGGAFALLTPAPLQASFLSSLSSNSFMDDLGDNLANWFKTAVWVGPGLVGTTSVAEGSILQSSTIGNSLKVDSKGKLNASEVISAAVTGWVASIIVNVTNVVGVTTPSPIIPIPGGIDVFSLDDLKGRIADLVKKLPNKDAEKELKLLRQALNNFNTQQEKDVPIILDTFTKEFKIEIPGKPELTQMAQEQINNFVKGREDTISEEEVNKAINRILTNLGL